MADLAAPYFDDLLKSQRLGVSGHVIAAFVRGLFESKINPGGVDFYSLKPKET